MLLISQNAFRVLLALPTPLPGLESPEHLAEAAAWAHKMMLSPRLREADAGEFPASLLEVLQERSWHPSVGFYPANRLPLRLTLL